jgi:hypothetical protein
MTVLDVAGWAMTAAPYVPAVVIPGLLVGAVYAAWHTTGAWRERRAKRAQARRTANRRDYLETAAIRHLGQRLHTHPHDAIDGELDHHLDQYAASIQALYPTGEQQ